jgi:hypothetical protein
MADNRDDGLAGAIDPLAEAGRAALRRGGVD